MKRTLAIVTIALAVTGLSYADTLEVLSSTSTPVSITPLEGDYSLVINHDNSSAAYVQDDTPSGETIYRFEFLYNPLYLGSSGNGTPWAMTIFGAMGTNPRPASATACPQAAHIPVFPARVFARYGGPGLTTPGVRLTVMTNFCGVVGSPVIYWSENVTKKICGFVQTGTPLYVGIAVVDPGQACPADGDPSYSLVPASGNNNEHAVEVARLGNLATNPYGAGENGTFIVDSFASYRTLAPRFPDSKRDEPRSMRIVAAVHCFYGR